MYNTKRAASIVASEKSLLFKLDKTTFTDYVKESSIGKRQKYEKLLSSIPILSRLYVYDRQSLCDVLVEETFPDGHIITKTGDKGDRMYIVGEGRALLFKMVETEQGWESIIVHEYGPGEYFGEYSLWKKVARTSTVIAKGEVKAVSIDKGTFRRLLKTIEYDVSINSDRYDKWINEAKNKLLSN